MHNVYLLLKSYNRHYTTLDTQPSPFSPAVTLPKAHYHSPIPINTLHRQPSRHPYSNGLSPISYFSVCGAGIFLFNADPSLPSPPLPRQEAEDKGAHEAGEREPNEGGIGLCLSAAAGTIHIGSDFCIAGSSAVDDVIVDKAIAEVVVFITGAGIGAN